MAETLEDRLSARLTAPAAAQVDVVVGTSADSDTWRSPSVTEERRWDGAGLGCGVRCSAGAAVSAGLQVRPDMQGRGIASALAAAAEAWLAASACPRLESPTSMTCRGHVPQARLAAAGCHSVQIEYEYLGDAYSDRLFLWYESSAGFHCSQGKPRAGCHQFRRCRKRLEPAPGEKGSAAASLPRVLPLCQLM
uniref:N-acetyltransferase domain-containing protein n=1 Tax=Emiliania huxleyi TaxID=2903 RepID=A0A7S3SWT7_EMIHU|mmetsp:Transcript_26796/g.80134  ORF Transcript_26796/g.80134 Transcript_26796/m.80134 type:complete len:193 (+) Transcript_26796:118-696(+)